MGMSKLKAKKFEQEKFEMSDKANKPIDTRLLAKPFSYIDLVSRQDGAVVSRTIIDKPEGTVTVFAF
jgi:hypothetical protein